MVGAVTSCGLSCKCMVWPLLLWFGGRESGVIPPWNLTAKYLNLPLHCARCALPVDLKIGVIKYFFMLFTMVSLPSRHFLPLPLHHSMVLHRGSQTPFWPDYDTVTPARLFLPSKRDYFPSYVYCHHLLWVKLYVHPHSTPQCTLSTSEGIFSTPHLPSQLPGGMRLPLPNTLPLPNKPYGYWVATRM